MKATTKAISMSSIILFFVGLGFVIYGLGKTHADEFLQSDIQLLVEERNEAILLIDNYPDVETWERLTSRRLDLYDPNRVYYNYDITATGVVRKIGAYASVHHNGNPGAGIKISTINKHKKVDDVNVIYNQTVYNVDNKIAEPSIIDIDWTGTNGNLILSVPVPSAVKVGDLITDSAGSSYLITKIFGSTLKCQDFDSIEDPVIGSAVIR